MTVNMLLYLRSYLPVIGGFSFSVSATEVSNPHDLGSPFAFSLDCGISDFNFISMMLQLYGFISIALELVKSVDVPVVYV